MGDLLVKHYDLPEFDEEKLEGISIQRLLVADRKRVVKWVEKNSRDRWASGV